MENSQQNSQPLKLKAAAMSDKDFHLHEMEAEDDTVLVAAFAIFSRKDFESMKFAGYSPVVIVGRDAEHKVRIEPFMIIGKGIDTCKLFTGFVSDVWRRYAAGESKKNEKEPEDSKKDPAGS